MTNISVYEKLGLWGDEKVFDAAGATRMSSARKSDRRPGHERISVDSDDSPGLG